MTTWPNKPDALNPAVASRFHLDPHRRRVSDPGRSGDAVSDDIQRGNGSDTFMAPPNQELREELQRIASRYSLAEVMDVLTEIASTPGEYTQCSFCGRDPHEIARLFAGSGVFICSACVDQFHKIKQEMHET